MIFFLGGVLLAAALAVIFAFIAARFRPAWSRGGIAVVAAVPLPVAGLALCAKIFVNVTRATSAECGVEACGMALMAAMMFASYCVIAYGASVFAAVYALRYLSRP